jgi:hypothetical protein
MLIAASVALGLSDDDDDAADDDDDAAALLDTEFK